MTATDRPQPRRRAAGIAAHYPELYQVADPLRTGMTAPLAEMNACLSAATTASEELQLPEVSDEERGLFSQEAYERQAAQSFLIAEILRSDEALRVGTGVSPEHLDELVLKEGQLLRLQTCMEQTQNDAADGKLLLGALHDFYEDKAAGYFDHKLSALPEGERPRLLQELAALHTLLRSESEADEAHWQGVEKERLRLEGKVEKTKAELDYLTARELLRQGIPVDEETLRGAKEHAEALAGLKPKPAAKPGAKTGAKPEAKIDAKADVKPEAKTDAKTDARSSVIPEAKTGARPGARAASAAKARERRGKTRG